MLAAPLSGFVMATAWQGGLGAMAYQHRVVPVHGGTITATGGWELARSSYRVRGVRAVWMVVLSLLVVLVSQAAEQRYDYDALGRLVRSSAGGSSVDYRYDPAGNLYEVTGAQAVTAPVVSTVSPSAIRRGQSAQVTLSGSGLSFANVTSPSATLAVSGVQAQASSLSFTLTVADDAPLGPQSFAVSSAAGSASFAIDILPKPPVLSVAPFPLAVAPDNVPRSFAIALSNVDTVAHTINLAMANPAIAQVSPATLTIAAGQTSAVASIRGVSGGSTNLSLTSATLQSAVVPVFVTVEFAGINTSYAPLVGVVLEAPPAPPPTRTMQLPARTDVGVVVGGYLESALPGAVSQNTSTTLTLLGKGLASAATIGIVPADGVTLGALSVAPDGLSATVPVTVAANASATLRQLILTDSGGHRFPAARADSDRLLIAYPVPVVESIAPLFATVGAPVSVTLRGRNLQQGKVQVSPMSGIEVDGAPAVSADGSAMTFSLGIGSLAALGEHLVTVTTPGGMSAGVKSPANTFTVVSTLNETLTPIVAPAVGVVLQANTPPASQPYGLYAPHLGVSMGPVVTSMTPRAGIVGETLTLSLQGKELAGVTALTFTPPDGLTLTGAPSAGDQSATVAVQIDAAAPKTARTVKAWAGTTQIPFSDPRQAQFLVTSALPRLDSVTPINLAAGTGPFALTLRGVNFKDASVVNVLPATGITLSQPPVVNADFTEITVNITVAAGAATGARVVTVTTPAGTTEAAASPANTVYIVTTLGDAVTPIQAPALGVVKLDNTLPPATTDIQLAAPIVGVVLQADPVPPAPQNVFLGGARLGVAVGPVARILQASPLRPGVAGTLTVSGAGLGAVVSVGANPAAGITLGIPEVQPDGLSLTVPITLAADAPAGEKELRLSDGVAHVPFSEASASRFTVAAGEPRIDSIAPILARQGETVTLTIRGTNLQGAEVLIEPAAGIVLGSAPVVSADGTELTLGLHVPADATVGGRILRVRAPGGITTDQAAPANTFTVYPP